MKAAIKAAIREWLDEQFARFGRWSMGAFMAALLAATVAFVLHWNGWTKAIEKVTH